MSTIARIGNALGYDVAETMLSEGCSLASVYAFAAQAAEVEAASKPLYKITPSSHSDIVTLETVRPRKVA